MAGFLRILAVALVTSFMVPAASLPVHAQDEDVDQSTKDRRAKEKEQRKSDKKFNEDKIYRFMVGPDVLPVGPYTISLYVRGQLVEGKLKIAILAKDSTAKNTLEGEKWAINGIVYPLALRMWENGRPTTEDIRNFKIDTKSQLQRRYDELIKEVFIVSIM